MVISFTLENSWVCIEFSNHSFGYWLPHFIIWFDFDEILPPTDTVWCFLQGAGTVETFNFEHGIYNCCYAIDNAQYDNKRKFIPCWSKSLFVRFSKIRFCRTHHRPWVHFINFSLITSEFFQCCKFDLQPKVLKKIYFQ